MSKKKERSRQGDEAPPKDALEELTTFVEADWAESRKKLRERVESSQWRVVVAVNNAGYMVLLELHATIGDRLVFCFISVPFCCGPVIACAIPKDAMSDDRLRSVLQRHDHGASSEWPEQDLILICSQQYDEALRQSVFRAVTAQAKGRCMVCGSDIYEDDYCNLCCRNSRDAVAEVGPQVIEFYRESLSRGFEKPVILLLNVFDREGRKLCEELKGSREVDSIIQDAKEEGCDITYIPHAIAREQLPIVLGEHYDPKEIEPHLEVCDTHILTCLISEAGPLLMTIPKDLQV